MRIQYQLAGQCRAGWQKSSNLREEVGNGEGENRPMKCIKLLEREENKEAQTVRVIGGCSCAIDNEGTIFKEEGQLTGASWSTCQPYHKGVCARVTAALKEPVEQVHSMSFVYLNVGMCMHAYLPQTQSYRFTEDSKLVLSYPTSCGHHSHSLRRNLTCELFITCFTLGQARYSLQIAEVCKTSTVSFLDCFFHR